MPKLGEKAAPEFRNLIDNPEDAAKVNEVLSEANAGERPRIDLPGGNLVNLPGGYIDDEGNLHRTAVVRELTGADEELMAKAASVQPPNPAHFINTILECGTEKIGDLNAEETRRALPKLLIGDREQLFVAIRAATYGSHVTHKGWACPFCFNELEEIEFDLLTDVNVRTLEHPESEIEFDVKLRRGQSLARVRLATGKDQAALFDSKMNKSQADTKLLSLCLLEYTDPEGHKIASAFVPTIPLKMGLMDRKKILKELVSRQPGPQLNDIKFNCEACGKEVSLATGLEELFLSYELLSDI